MPLSERMRVCFQWMWLARWSFTCETVRVHSEFAEAHVPFSAWQAAERAGRDVRSASSTTSKVRADTNCGARRQDGGRSCELRMRKALSRRLFDFIEICELKMTCDDRSVARRAQCVEHRQHELLYVADNYSFTREVLWCAASPLMMLQARFHYELASANIIFHGTSAA